MDIALRAERAGFVAAIDTLLLANAVIEMGGGRKKMGDQIDHSVGLEMTVRVGDRVARGQPLLRVFAADDDHPRMRSYLRGAVTIADEDQIETSQLIHDRWGVPEANA